MSTDEKQTKKSEVTGPELSPSIEPAGQQTKGKSEKNETENPVQQSESESKNNAVEVLTEPEVLFQKPDLTLDVTQFVLGRHFSNFPLSPNRIDALSQLGFSYATRMQTAVLDYGLAQLSACVPLSAGNSRYLPLCVSALERSFDTGLVIIITPTDQMTDLICTDLLAFAGGQELTILPIKESNEMAEQEAVLNEKVDIIVGQPARVSALMASLKNPTCIFLGFCDLSESQKAPAIEDLFKSIGSTEQLIAMYESNLNRDFYEKLKAFHPKSTLIDFALQPKKHKRQLIRTADKISSSVSLALSTESSIAFICGSEEESQRLLTALSNAGLLAHFIWNKSNRRSKDKILRQMRSNKAQCIVMTEANVDRNVAAQVVLFTVPENLGSISGFPGTVTWVLDEDEDATSIEALNPTLYQPPSISEAQNGRNQRLFDGLLQVAQVRSESLWLPLAKQILSHPHKEALICAALEQFAANARAESHERREEISRLESKEERMKNAPRRPRRKSKYRRRR